MSEQEIARELNDAIDSTRKDANTYMNETGCKYNEAFKAAKYKKGINEFSDIVNKHNVAELDNSKVKVYKMDDTKMTA